MPLDTFGLEVKSEARMVPGVGGLAFKYEAKRGNVEKLYCTAL